LRREQLKTYFAFALYLSLALHSGANAQSAEQLIKQAQDKIKNAKSYQATVVMEVSGTGRPSQTMTSVVKLIPFKKTALTMTPPGIQVVDDGQTLYSYLPTAKTYSKGPTQVKSQSIGISQIAGLAKQATFKLRSPAVVTGRPCHVIQIVPKTPVASGGSVEMLLYIDKQTSSMRQFTSRMTAKAPGQPKPIRQAAIVTVKDERFDAPIPDSVFRFTPPPGAKEGPSMNAMLGGSGPRSAPLQSPGGGTRR
jgi:outer membrane lipoprotein-sorting protein